MSRFKFFIVALLAIALWQWGAAAMIHAKAAVAPLLIESAWAKTLERREPTKPWPWADTWPVARLSVTAHGIEHYVLAGANGASLPFGPGHLTGSAAPDEPGTIVISGHRDTHFRFLPDVDIGDEIELGTAVGTVRRFKVIRRSVVNADNKGIELDDTRNQLILVTCQPTRMFTYRGPYRLVVTAESVAM